MKDSAPLPESDRAQGAPHPRETETLFGQDVHETEFLDAFNSGRLHHGWLISGPRGIGKATFVWRAARFLLTQPVSGDVGLFGENPSGAQNLSVSSDTALTARLLALSDPRVLLLRPAWDEEKGKFKQGILIDDVRRLREFFTLSAPDGGRRIAIIDAADDLNPNAANALLKVLEEPPADVLIFLISHQPSRLLPTIRSRCRILRLDTLSPQNMELALKQAGVSLSSDVAALSELASGSVGEAVRLTNLDGLAAYGEIISVFSSLPRLDRTALIALSESVASAKAQSRYELLLGLMDIFLSRLARTGAAGAPLVEATAGELTLLTRLSPDPAAGRAWAEAQQILGQRARHGKGVNLDPSSLILDMGFRINETAAKWAAK